MTKKKWLVKLPAVDDVEGYPHTLDTETKIGGKKERRCGGR